MKPQEQSSPVWLEPLCQIALRYRSTETLIGELFQEAAPNLDNPGILNLVAEHLALEPRLIEAWQSYPYGKRATPSPYLDGNEVGFVHEVGSNLQRDDVRHLETTCDACALFIVREAFWILRDIDKRAN